MPTTIHLRSSPGARSSPASPSGWGSLAPHAFLTPEASLGFAAVLIALIAGIYFGFAVMNGSGRDQFVEFNVSGLFAVTGLLGLLYWPVLLPAAYFGHAVWDLAHHNRKPSVPWSPSRRVVRALVRRHRRDRRHGPARHLAHPRPDLSELGRRMRQVASLDHAAHGVVDRRQLFVGGPEWPIFSTCSGVGIRLPSVARQRRGDPAGPRHWAAASPSCWNFCIPTSFSVAPRTFRLAS